MSEAEYALDELIDDYNAAIESLNDNNYHAAYGYLHHIYNEMIANVNNGIFIITHNLQLKSLIREALIHSIQLARLLHRPELTIPNINRALRTIRYVYTPIAPEGGKLNCLSCNKKL